MVGKVLTFNGITRRERGTYALVGGEQLSDAERDQLLALNRKPCSRHCRIGSIVGSTLSRACFASFRSWLPCIRSQKPSLRPKKRHRRRSVSAVMARLPFTIALMRLSGTPIASANRDWLIPMGRRNSSSSTSPGGTSITSVLVNDLDLFWPGVRPDKAEPELVVDALISETGPVLAMAVPPERLQAIARWDLQIVETGGRFEDGELPEDELAEGGASKASKAAPRLPFKEGLGVAATKRPDHTLTLPPLDVGTPGSGTGRRRTRADIAAWLACVPPLTSATPRLTQQWCVQVRCCQRRGS